MCGNNPPCKEGTEICDNTEGKCSPCTTILLKSIDNNIYLHQQSFITRKYYFNYKFNNNFSVDYCIGVECKTNEKCDYYSRECKCGSDESCENKAWAPTCNYKVETDSYLCECGSSETQCIDTTERCIEVESECAGSKKTIIFP